MTSATLIQSDPFTPRQPQPQPQPQHAQRERPWYLQKRDELRQLARWSLMPIASPVPIDDPIADRWFR